MILFKFFNFLALSCNQLMFNATKAMATICRYCDGALAPHYSHIYSKFIPCLQSLPLSGQGNIIEGLARLISKLPDDQTYPALQQLITPIYNNLGNLLQSNNPETVSK